MRTILLIMIGISSLMASNFSRNANGVITDSRTNLEWQDDYSNNGNSIKQTGWQSAIDYCENLNLDANNDWRLPNLNELTSLVDDTTYNPAIDGLFQNSNSNYYWSSTTNINSNNVACFVYFSNGYQNSSYKDNLYSVRCVRAGWYSVHNNTEGVTKVAETTKKLATEYFAQGVITQETIIPVTTTSGETLSSITLAEDTQFEDENGQQVTESVTLAIKTSQATTSSLTIGFKDSVGNQLKPTKDIVLEMIAPVGATDGDKIEINIPNSIGKLTKQEKLTIVIVRNGRIVFRISVNAFFPDKNIVILLNLIRTGGQ